MTSPQRHCPVVALCASCILVAHFFLSPAAVAQTEVDPEAITFQEALVLPPVGQFGRNPLFTDAIEHALATGSFKRPADGDAARLSNGREVKWKKLTADAAGTFTDAALQGGYLFVSFDSTSERIAVLRARAHTMVYVNGEPRVGDPYDYGNVQLPVKIRKGENWLLFVVARGRLPRFELVSARGGLQMLARDITFPDLVADRRERLLCAVPVMNLSEKPAQVRTNVPGDQVIAPLSVRKIAAWIEPGFLEVSLDGKSADTVVTVSDADGHSSNLRMKLRIRNPSETRRITFFSRIDGSVQYYALNPASTLSPAPAMVLTLHGASVEAIGQADAYSSKSWAHLVAPTNRRAFGFDWEDWGRLDAIEVLEHAQKSLETDPNRVYLTGHSMGGHGTWQIGAHFPDRFAAIGPSAGWISFRSYAGARATQPTTSPATQALQAETRMTVADALRLASNPSDTLLLARNYARLGVYVLHGDADDNVPVSEARRMAEELRAFHRDWVLFEQKGAGHWWDEAKEPGADCVDWAPMFDLFATRRLPAMNEVRDVDFTTVNPAISGRCFWVTVEQQAEPMKPSRVQLRLDPHSRRIAGTTVNVASLSIAAAEPGAVHHFEIDGGSVSATPDQLGRMTLRRDRGKWSASEPVPAGEKRPERGGGLKQAFNNRFLLVYGTGGTSQEKEWALAKARYDAEVFWYRGNGAVDVIADTDFAPENYKDRSVILYGNRSTNGAWAKLLTGAPVEMTSGALRIGDRSFKGDDLAAVFLYPRKDSDLAHVAVIGGTGIAGMRTVNRLPIFLSGAGFPDCLVLSTSALSDGISGVRMAGYFGNDWSVERGSWGTSD